MESLCRAAEMEASREGIMPSDPFDDHDGCSAFTHHLPSRQNIQRNWKNITEEFNEAASHLKLGELLHDSIFGLFEAMSAIEMMDPKMDAGMMCNQSGHKVLNLQESIEAGRLKTADLTNHELIGIMDTTFACLATWLEGHSLAQTVFTNLYAHNPDLIDDRCLRAFSLVVLKMVDTIKDKVMRAGVFEEEDFQSMTYGFKLAHNVTELRVVGMLKEIEEDYNRRVRSTRARQGEDRDTATELEHEECIAVVSRIKFCRMFYSALLAFTKKEIKQSVEEGKKLLLLALDLLPPIQKTVELGDPQVISEDESSPAMPDYPNMMGFEPLVNQRLLPPTFPRYAKIISRRDAISYLEGLVTRLRTVCEVTSLTSFHSIVDFFTEFSKQCPCVLSRSVLQQIFLPYNNKKVFGVELVQECLRDTLRGFVCPPVLAPRSPIYNNAQAKEMADSMLMHSVRPMCSLIQIHGHNRARQRDKFGQLLEELATLQDQAEKVDANLHTIMSKAEVRKTYEASFSCWVMYHTLRTMILYVQSGFELELYGIHEYHYIFWYLSDFLYAWFISTLSQADSMLGDHESQYTEPQGKGRSNKKKAKRKRPRPLERELALSKAQQALCSGYYKAVMGFRLDSKIKQPNSEFDNEKVRFEHRFNAFATILTPPLVQYDQFCEITTPKAGDTPPRSLALYGTASELFSHAAELLDKVPSPNAEIQSLIRVAKTNNVVLRLLVGGHKRDSQAPPQFDFNTHRTFPIIKLV
ncbi:N-alpha-acetyltransferase 35, NatC auxiliary subunit-like [Lytechinus variegatus]|uniref:N-alpha-acetyltransferase 35, NatC auxiliary subunit-like n=1 Tax=Lytechinus variegatus TaxID=7654 RepID=UPI001BB1D2B0|nr:N-alpha-acetyltransferase 35, NatC auxiliary subunit-like [Lytechinus variegatus]